MKLAQGILLSAILVSILSLTSIGDPAYQSSARISNIERTDAAELQAMKEVTRISPEQALSIAKRKAPSSTISQIELENEDGNVVYEVDFVKQGVERTLIIDAGNGNVLADFVDD